MVDLLCLRRALICLGCFGIFLVLTSLGFCLLHQPLAFSHFLPKSAILELVISDERSWWFAKYALILAKLTYPDILELRWAMIVGLGGDLTPMAGGQV